MTGRWRLTWATAPAVAVALQALILVAFLANTRPLEVNGGLGYDGRQYAAMVSWLRGEGSTVPETPFAYRSLPSALVAVSGLDVRVGFLALNVIALVAGGLLMLRFLRREGATPRRALLLVAWFALLPTGLRHAVAYPVLVDGIGTLFFIALLAAAQERRLLLFATLLVPAVLTREHLLLLAPLAVAADPRPVRRAAVLAAPALAAMVLIRLFPPYPVADQGTLYYLAVNLGMILFNIDGALVRLLAAPLLSLGILLSIALAAPRAVRATLRRPGWAYAAVVVVVTGTVGGLDHDRYFLWLAPFLMVAAARTSWSPVVGILLTGLHVVAARAVVPLDGTASAYLRSAVATMPLADLATWTSVAGGAIVVGWFVQRARPLRAPWTRGTAVR